ncbi:hypothetical protein [Lactobacillus sp. PSON]|uniref:hypothetical protein n=1 Tax=Lactobacillus sp. PSON TaxID=3455454 RepID=UPI00404111E5
MNSIKNFFNNKTISKFITAFGAFICIFVTGVDFGIILLQKRFSLPNIGEPILGIATLVIGIRQLYLLAKK